MRVLKGFCLYWEAGLSVELQTKMTGILGIQHRQCKSNSFVETEGFVCGRTFFFFQKEKQMKG